jgi:hypothetical protein
MAMIVSLGFSANMCVCVCANKYQSGLETLPGGVVVNDGMGGV